MTQAMITSEQIKRVTDSKSRGVTETDPKDPADNDSSN